MNIKNEDFNMFLKIIASINKYTNDPKYNDIITLLKRINNEHSIYFLPHFNKDKNNNLCLHCNSFPSIYSHSVSKNQLLAFANNEQLYYINSYNILFLFNSIYKMATGTFKGFIKFPFIEISPDKASTFLGFCGDLGNNHDFSLFSNIDGNLGINLKELKKEILYRTVSWQYKKIQEEQNILQYLSNANNTINYFDIFWKEVILDNINYLENSDNYFSKQIEITNKKFLNLDNYLKIIKNNCYNPNSIIENQYLNSYSFILEPITKPHFMGINVILGYKKETRILMENLGFFHTFICGILFINNQYYYFILYDSRDNINTKNYFKDIVEPFLLLLESENTFICESQLLFIQNNLLDNP